MKQHNSESSTLKTQWREYIVSEVMDILRDVYRFYITEPKAYIDTP